MIRLCANCGTKIYVGAQGWGYAYDGRYTCTYRCMREMRRRDKMKEELKAKIEQLAAQGKKCGEIAAELGVTIHQVRSYLAAKRAAKRMSTKPAETADAVEVPEIIQNTEAKAAARTDLAAVVDLMRQMLEIIGKMVDGS